MATELRNAPAESPGTEPDKVIVDRRRQARRAWFLFAAAAWNAYVWLTRLGIVMDDARSVPFRVVHAVLIFVSLAFAVGLAAIGWRMWRELRDSRGRDRR